MGRTEIDKLMKADTLVYKLPETKLEKNMELYDKYGVFAIAVQNGKYVGHTMLLGTRKLNKKSFSGLKTSLFKKEVNVQLYFVRPTFIIECNLNSTFDAAGKPAHFKGKVNAKLELSDPAKFANFVEQFASDRKGIIVTEADMGGFIIGAALTEMIPAGKVRAFKPGDPNVHGGRTHETYMGQLVFRTYFRAENVNRYTAIGLKARSIEVEPIELSF